MPELPEVESVRLSLEKRVLGRSVSGVIVRRRDVIATPDDPAGGLSRQHTRRTSRGSPRQSSPRRVEKSELLVGDAVVALRRHGKQLALVGSGGRVVLIHLGMTGEVMAPGPGTRLRAADHLHVLWTLHNADGTPAGRMVFRDPRRFGGIWTLPDERALDARWGELGPDGLSVTPDALAARAGGSSRAIKAVLLDQRAVAGVGNIYADESLFRAAIHPARPARDLTPSEWAALSETIRGVLARAVELRGSTLRDYRDAEGQAGQATSMHMVYGRAGLPCTSCGTTLASGSVGQRTTVWCPSCQADGDARSRS